MNFLVVFLEWFFNGVNGWDLLVGTASIASLLIVIFVKRFLALRSQQIRAHLELPTLEAKVQASIKRLCTKNPSITSAENDFVLLSAHVELYNLLLPKEFHRRFNAASCAKKADTESIAWVAETRELLALLTSHIKKGADKV